jgi:transposase
MEKAEGLAAFVGIDAHSSHCSVKAIGRQGENLLTVDVPTQARALRAALRALPRPRAVLLESSSQATLIRGWLWSAVEEVVVCETRENRLIAQSEDKSDPADAARLARLLRLGEYKAVYMPARAGQERRELVRLYQKLVGDATRLKNRLKAKYREHGVNPAGASVYSVRHRGDWLKQVKSPAVRAMLEVLYGQLDAAQAAAVQVWRELFPRLRSRPEYGLLQTIPGVGSRRAAILVAGIDEAERFANKRRLWKYCGLGVRSRWSSDSSRARVSGSPSGNRLLKYAALGAATDALRGENRFSRHYRGMLEQGSDAALARRTVARQILAIALAMWKSGTAYREPALEGSGSAEARRSGPGAVSCRGLAEKAQGLIRRPRSRLPAGQVPRIS